MPSTSTSKASLGELKRQALSSAGTRAEGGCAGRATRLGLTMYSSIIGRHRCTWQVPGRTAPPALAAVRPKKSFRQILLRARARMAPVQHHGDRVCRICSPCITCLTKRPRRTVLSGMSSMLMLDMPDNPRSAKTASCPACCMELIGLGACVAFIQFEGCHQGSAWACTFHYMHRLPYVGGGGTRCKYCVCASQHGVCKI